MSDETALKNINHIFKEIFGVDGHITDLNSFHQTYAADLLYLPIEKPCAGTGKPTYINPMDKNKNVISSEYMTEKFREDEYITDKQPINSIEELFTAFEKINTVRGESLINSFNCAKSTNIRDSSDVYYCANIGVCKNAYYSYSIYNSEWAAACADGDMIAYCIRATNVAKVSNSFAVDNSNTVRNSIFVHDCNDVKDSMFCHHLVSKQYCVANMQYTKEEYEEIKKLVFTNWPAIVSRYVLGRA